MTTPDRLDYNQLLLDHPWITQPGLSCVLSPDSDGMLCGLLMTNALGWNVAGFYDGKVLILRDGLKPKDCVFLDIEINRPDVRSVGHHLMVWSNRILPRVPNFNLASCIQPNNLRGIDGRDSFQRKYPFGTIHLLVSILYESGVLERLAEEATTVLLFTDGVWNNLFGYTENCLDWFSYLRFNDPGQPLHHIFNHTTSIHDVMADMNRFLRVRDQCNASGMFVNGTYATGGRNLRTGDKLRISNPDGSPINLEQDGNVHRIHQKEKDRVEQFLNALTDRTGWVYNPNQWCWKGLTLRKMEKGAIKPSNERYIDLFRRNPLSLAMTSSDLIEFTVEHQP